MWIKAFPHFWVISLFALSTSDIVKHDPSWEIGVKLLVSGVPALGRLQTNTGGKGCGQFACVIIS